MTDAPDFSLLTGQASATPHTSGEDVDFSLLGAPTSTPVVASEEVDFSLLGGAPTPVTSDRLAQLRTSIASTDTPDQLELDEYAKLRADEDRKTSTLQAIGDTASQTWKGIKEHGLDIAKGLVTSVADVGGKAIKEIGTSPSAGVDTVTGLVMGAKAGTVDLANSLAGKLSANFRPEATYRAISGDGEAHPDWDDSDYKARAEAIMLRNQGRHEREAEATAQAMGAPNVYKAAKTIGEFAVPLVGMSKPLKAIGAAKEAAAAGLQTAGRVAGGAALKGAAEAGKVVTHPVVRTGLEAASGHPLAIAEVVLTESKLAQDLLGALGNTGKHVAGFARGISNFKKQALQAGSDLGSYAMATRGQTVVERALSELPTQISAARVAGDAAKVEQLSRYLNVAEGLQKADQVTSAASRLALGLGLSAVEGAAIGAGFQAATAPGGAQDLSPGVVSGAVIGAGMHGAGAAAGQVAKLGQPAGRVLHEFSTGPGIKPVESPAYKPQGAEPAEVAAYDQVNTLHEQGMTALKDADPTQAAIVSGVREFVRPFGGEVYVLPAEDFAALPNALSQASGFYKRDGRRIFLNANADAALHEPGHLIVDTLSPAKKAGYLKSLIDSMTPEQFQAAKASYEARLGNGKVTDAYFAEELAADALSTAIKGEISARQAGKPSGIVGEIAQAGTKFGQATAAAASRVLEQAGLYKPRDKSGSAMALPGAKAALAEAGAVRGDKASLADYLGGVEGEPAAYLPKVAEDVIVRELTGKVKPTEAADVVDLVRDATDRQGELDIPKALNAALRRSSIPAGDRTAVVKSVEAGINKLGVTDRAMALSGDLDKQTARVGDSPVTADRAGKATPEEQAALDAMMQLMGVSPPKATISSPSSAGVDMVALKAKLRGSELTQPVAGPAGRYSMVSPGVSTKPGAEVDLHANLATGNYIRHAKSVEVTGGGLVDSSVRSEEVTVGWIRGSDVGAGNIKISEHADALNVIDSTLNAETLTLRQKRANIVHSAVKVQDLRGKLTITPDSKLAVVRVPDTIIIDIEPGKGGGSITLPDQNGIPVEMEIPHLGVRDVGVRVVRTSPRRFLVETPGSVVAVTGPDSLASAVGRMVGKRRAVDREQATLWKIPYVEPVWDAIPQQRGYEEVISKATERYIAQHPIPSDAVGASATLWRKWAARLDAAAFSPSIPAPAQAPSNTLAGMDLVPAGVIAGQPELRKKPAAPAPARSVAPAKAQTYNAPSAPQTREQAADVKAALNAIFPKR